MLRIVDSQLIQDEYQIPGNWSVKVEDGVPVEAGDVIATRGESQVIVSHAGRLRLEEKKAVVAYDQVDEREVGDPRQRPPAGRGRREGRRPASSSPKAR